MFPRLYERRRKVSLWVQRRLGVRRDATVSPATVQASVGFGAPTITATSAPINEGDPLDVQIKALDHRIDLVERAMTDERAERGRPVTQLREDTQHHFESLHSKDAEMRELALGLSLGTVRLQMRGVVLIACGTIVGSIPVLFG